MTAPPLISIIDDDEPSREATKGLVETFGFAAEAFASAHAFLRSDRLSRTACLIIDVQMPEMSGLELQSHLMATGHRTPIIFITASADRAVRTQAMRSGAADYLLKPYDPKTLLDAIRSVLEGGHGDSAH